MSITRLRSATAASRMLAGAAPARRSVAARGVHRSTLAAPAALLLYAMSSAAIADTIRVPDDYATIQAAIDAAADGDEILVAPGTYYEAITFRGRAVHLRSARGVIRVHGKAVVGARRAGDCVLPGDLPIENRRHSVQRR